MSNVLEKEARRKATVINAGQTYSTYRDFAIKYGYPDAAALTDRDDTRNGLRNGEEVTLLASGVHLTDTRKPTLWIVEAANGERYVIKASGLRIEESASPLGITTLPDESLGGILREYREVERNANVGERIKITSSRGRFDVPAGTITKVTRANQFSDWSVDTELRLLGIGSDWFLDADFVKYVVLEPTDIYVINGERVALVERKAYVGERIISLVDDEDTHKGGVYVVDEVFNSGAIDYVDDIDEDYRLSLREYRVVVPVEKAASPAPTPTYIEGLTDAVAKLTARLNEHRTDIETLTKRVDAIVGFGEGVSGVVEKLRAKTPELTRDAIVERAKADVEALLDRARNGMDTPETKRRGNLTFEFVVNNEKRTVVAVGKLRHVSDALRVRGIAKCAPGECFNVHIGKAIALRRALRLDVPEEYVKAPQPTEARVGDIVRGRLTGLKANVTRVSGNWAFGVYEDGDELHSPDVKVIDDSREQSKRKPAVGDSVRIVNPRATNVGYVSAFAGCENACIRAIDDSPNFPYRICGNGATIWCAREAFELIDGEVSAA